MDIALAAVLATLGWVWSHLQGGWLVAVILISLLLANGNLGSHIDRLEAEIEELKTAKDDDDWDDVD